MVSLPTLPVAGLCLLALGCAPSHGELFGPVQRDVRARTGVTPEWRSDWRQSPEARRQVRELLGDPLDADRAARIAVLNSPRLQADYARLASARARVASARALPNPELEAELRFPTEGDDPADIELGAMVSVADLLALFGRSGAASADLRAAQRRAVADTLSTMTGARVAFYRLAAAEARLASRRGAAETAGAAGALADALRAAGNITELDRLAQRTFAEEMALDVEEAEAELTAARADLAAVLGLHGDEANFTVASELPRVPVHFDPGEPLEEASVAASESLAATRLELEAAGERVGVARFRSFLPGLAAGVSATREDGWAVGPAVAFELPLFSWGAGERAEAWADVQRLQAKYAAEALDVRSAARDAEARLAAAHASVTRLREVIVPLRRRLLEEGVLQYNAMNLSPFELLVLRRELFLAEERLAMASIDFQVAQAGVDALRSGTTLVGTGGRGTSTRRGPSVEREDH